MATFTNRKLVEELVRADGRYPGDPQADSIYEYEQTGIGKKLYAVFYRPQDDDLTISPYVESFDLLWSKKEGGITAFGKEWLEKKEKGDDE